MNLIQYMARRQADSAALLYGQHTKCLDNMGALLWLLNLASAQHSGTAVGGARSGGRHPWDGHGMDQQRKHADLHRISASRSR
jgi:hypothetical protein